MTTPVNHTVAAGFQMGTDGAGLEMAAQTSECRVQLTQLTHGYTLKTDEWQTFTHRKVTAGPTLTHSYTQLCDENTHPAAEIVAVDDI